MRNKSSRKAQPIKEMNPRGDPSSCMGMMNTEYVLCHLIVIFNKSPLVFFRALHTYRKVYPLPSRTLPSWWLCCAKYAPWTSSIGITRSLLKCRLSGSSQTYCIIWMLTRFPGDLCAYWSMSSHGLKQADRFTHLKTNRSKTLKWLLLRKVEDWVQWINHLFNYLIIY